MNEEKEAHYGSGSGSDNGYVVEARSGIRKPISLTCGMVLDSEWRRVHYERSPIGVFVQTWAPGFTDQGLLDFTSANALAWWFVSNAMESGRDNLPPFRAIGVEVRLVKVRYHYTFSTEELGVGVPLNVTDRDKAAFVPRILEAEAITA